MDTFYEHSVESSGFQNMLTLPLLWAAKLPPIVVPLEFYAFEYHEHYLWMKQQDNANTHTAYVSSVLMPTALSHWTSLTKHKQKENIIKNFKMA